MVKRGYTQGGFNKSRVLSSGRVLKYNKASPVAGSSRAFRKFAKRGGNPYGLQRAVRMSKELGYVDVAVANYVLNTSGQCVHLNVVPQGTTVNTRVGKKIRMKGIQCRGFMKNDTTAILNDVAFMIVYDRRPTGSLPAITDILVSASSTAFNNDANSGRFQILKREDYTLTGNPLNATTITERTVVEGSFFLGLKDMPTVFKAAGTGAIGDIEQGALYLLTVGNVAAGTAAATATLAFRVRFMDV